MQIIGHTLVAVLPALAGVREPGRLVDRLATVLCFACASVPGHVFAVVPALVFALHVPPPQRAAADAARPRADSRA